jgi:small subunit ribosomal protein S2e
MLACLITAPSTCIISGLVPKNLLLLLLLLASTDDRCISASGCTDALGRLAKTTFDAISKTYSCLTPDLWNKTKPLYSELTNYLIKPLPYYLCGRSRLQLLLPH